MIKLKAVIFDFDGTILDTETPDFLAWQHIFKNYGLELDIQRWCSVVGTGFSPNTFDPILEIQSRTKTADTPLKIKEQHTILFHKMVESLQPIPGVISALEYLTSRQIRLAVASSSKRKWVEGHLIKWDLLRYFQTIVTADDVENIKPAPDLYLTALEKLKVLPEEAIAIEDSANGFLAATAATLRSVIVPNSITKNLCFNHAYSCVETLEDFDFSKLINV